MNNIRKEEEVVVEVEEVEVVEEEVVVEEENLTGIIKGRRGFQDSNLRVLHVKSIEVITNLYPISNADSLKTANKKREEKQKEEERTFHTLRILSVPLVSCEDELILLRVVQEACN
jgi:hypothetical protein